MLNILVNLNQILIISTSFKADKIFLKGQLILSTNAVVIQMCYSRGRQRPSFHI